MLSSSFFSLSVNLSTKFVIDDRALFSLPNKEDAVDAHDDNLLEVEVIELTIDGVLNLTVSIFD